MKRLSEENQPKAGPAHRASAQSTGKKRKRTGPSAALQAVLLAGSLTGTAACISAAFITGRATLNRAVRALPPAGEAAPITAVPGKPAEQTPPAAAPRRPAAPPERPGPERRGTVVFVIDDAGNNLSELEPFLRFPGPLTIAVLPGLPHSAEAARRVRAAGKEVFLHQPMEAVGGKAPGPGAVYADMEAGEIRAVLRQNTSEIGPVAGMNNHQGSKITMDQAAIETVLDFCREEGICFLDSRTTPETAAPMAAKRLGIKIGERDVFIDNEQSRAAMIRCIEEGLVRAERQGSAVLIGHAWSPDLAPVLAEFYPDLAKQGYSFSTASALIAGQGE